MRASPARTHARPSKARIARVGGHADRAARRSHRHGAIVTDARIACLACIARVTRIARIASRHSIAAAPSRHDFDQCRCIHAIRARMKPPMPPRGIVRLDGVRAPARGAGAPIRGHRAATRAGMQTNDRFKRRAGYLGTTVSSKTRSGRGWWPGQ
ncbi:hypothetical protein GQ56_0102700 [Burkholderia paludis]|nr:hypothetical protein GQ56_0102700 [Burkholderia paludis]